MKNASILLIFAAAASATELKDPVEPTGKDLCVPEFEAIAKDCAGENVKECLKPCMKGTGVGKDSDCTEMKLAISSCADDCSKNEKCKNSVFGMTTCYMKESDIGCPGDTKKKSGSDNSGSSSKTKSGKASPPKVAALA